jgi:hypothetical protein
MAFNRNTYAAAQRVQMYTPGPRPPRGQGIGHVEPLAELPYDRLKVDGVDYFETMGPQGSIGPSGRPPSGYVVGFEVIANNASIPVTMPGQVTGVRGVWQLGFF